MGANQNRIMRHINELGKYTATPGEGVTRFTYSKEDLQARHYIKEAMKECGLTVSEDGLGNITGKLNGTKENAPSVLVGSHYDSVPNGGKYDGTAGVVAGLEIAALFKEQKLVPTYPLEIIAMVEEEGSRFGVGLMGSRGMLGSLSEAELKNLRDKNNKTVSESMNSIGLKADFTNVRKPETIKAFLEMHIEQGPILEEKQIPIGIVEKIVGLSQLKITVTGRAGHAGTTPMDRRADALVIASTIVAKLPSIAIEVGESTVITTGQHDVYPNGANVIPDKVIFTVDIRSPKEENIEEAIEKVEELVSSIKGSDIHISVENQSYVEPKNMTEDIQTLFTEASKKLNLTYHLMSSGAGHDAMIFSDITNTGMVFVPSKNGLSHCPEEWSAPEDLARGVDVLFEAVKKLVILK